jgi:DNA polymerase III subunit alpha
MRNTLKEIQARTADDIMVALALYRPGPLMGGLKDAFVQRYRNETPVDHLHPALTALLSETQGVILYQEQVLRIAHELAGLSLADADLLRRAMSHFDPGQRMISLKDRFIQGAYAHQGIPEETAERIWDLMAAFAGYGFPKAHAASYAQVAWQAAWCKANHPAIFLAAVLANWGGYYNQRVYLIEARRLGLRIQPPNINYSQKEFSLSYRDNKEMLYMGLDQVRGLTRRTQDRIIHRRPFSSLHDFLTRTDPRPAEVENLIQVGALEGMGNIPRLLSQLEHQVWRGGQLTLFSFNEDDSVDWSLEEKVKAQEDILGVGVSAHPLELIADKIQNAGVISTLDAATKVGQAVRIAGIRQTSGRKQLGGGRFKVNLTLEDQEGFFEVVIDYGKYQRYKRELIGAEPFIVEGVVEIDRENGEPMLLAERLWLLR